ncbi:MAG: hypothetical protein IJS67_05195 [Clostridia bacterium]|nr:hypothetical protein [Clostridia bacterium]
MKKYIALLTAILVFLFSAPTVSAGVFADENENAVVATDIFLPASYLQYYKLDAPYALCRYEDDDGKEVIALSHKNAIVLYRDEKFYSIPIELDDNQVKCLSHYGKYLLYVFDSELYKIDMTDFNDPDWKAEDHTDNTRIVCNAFSVRGDKLVYSTSDNVYLCSITDEDVTVDAVTKDYSFMITFSPTTIVYAQGKIYYNSSADNRIYAYDQSAESSSVLPDTPSGVRCMAEYEGKLYYTTSDGIFAFDGQNNVEIRLSDKTATDLGSIVDPYGLTVNSDGKLWVVDRTINAVQEIDLNKAGFPFTEFAITTNSNAVNRLSGEATDISTDGEKIYALDGDRIVVINSPEGERSYNRILLEDGGVKHFAAGEGYLLYSVNAQIKLFAIGDEGEPDLTAELKKKFEDKDFNNICDACYSEGKFYIMNTLFENGITRPVVYEVDAKTATLSRVDFTADGGEGRQIVADAFGGVYFAQENSGKYAFYKIEDGEAKKIYEKDKTDSLLNLQTDLSGALYALYENNAIEKYTADEATEKTLVLSDNLAGAGDARSVCLSYKSENAYFIFSGLILKARDKSALSIATPAGIVKPASLGFSYDENRTFAKIKDGAKTFLTGIGEGEYFDFLGYGSDYGEDLAVYAVSEDFSLAVGAKNSLIVRNIDLYGHFTSQSENFTAYARVSASTYSLPVMDEKYASGSIAAHDAVKVVATLTFNGRKFYAVNRGGVTGYIPADFLTEALAEYSTPSALSSVNLYSEEGVTIYADKEMTKQLTVVYGKTQVALLEEGDGYLAVFYDGQKGFVSPTCVDLSGSGNAVKAVVIAILALSVMITALFLEKKVLYRKEKEGGYL